jgi:hypothetical protein
VPEHVQILRVWMRPGLTGLRARREGVPVARETRRTEPIETLERREAVRAVPASAVRDDGCDESGRREENQRVGGARPHLFRPDPRREGDAERRQAGVRGERGSALLALSLGGEGRGALAVASVGVGVHDAGR